MKVKIENPFEIYIWDHSSNGSFIESCLDTEGKKSYVRMGKTQQYKVEVGRNISLYTAIKIRILGQLESVVCTGEIGMSYIYFLKVVRNLYDYKLGINEN